MIASIAPSSRNESVPAAADSLPMPFSGGVRGGPRVLLRAEGAAVLVAALFAFAHLGASWWLFGALFLVPDLSFVGYLGGPRAGAIAYNAAHGYVGPAALALVGLAVPAVLPIVAIWIAHIGADRALGYGLKYATAFGDTHLGRVGRADSSPSAIVTNGSSSA